MTVDERLADLAARVAALEAETLDANEGRLTRNSDAKAAALRAQQPDPETLRRNALVADLRQRQPRLDQLLKWQAEATEKLAAHRTKEPSSRGSAEWSIWRREFEEFEDTLREIDSGSSTSGHIWAWSKRDDAPIAPGLRQTQRTVDALRAELGVVV